MKVAAFFIFIFCFCLHAEDGLEKKFAHVEMNINDDNYILFEDNSLVICDRYTDEYVVEISEDFDLFIRGKKIPVNKEQRKLLENYYIAQYNLFSSRNIIGAKGVEIGIQSAGLAIKAVGGAFVLMASGFDEDAEQEYQDGIELESKKIEEHAKRIEEEADEFERQVDLINHLEREISRKIDELDQIDLHVDKESLCITSD